MRLTLPWIDRRLSPNNRLSWRAKLRPKREAYDTGFYAALDAHDWQHDPPLTGNLRVTYRICPPDKRRRDQDNILASMKPVVDGVCKGLCIDDSQFRQTVIEWGEVVPGGQVVMLIDELP